MKWLEPVVAVRFEFPPIPNPFYEYTTISVYINASLNVAQLTVLGFIKITEDKFNVLKTENLKVLPVQHANISEKKAFLCSEFPGFICFSFW